jgi:hypothetical protein
MAIIFMLALFALGLVFAAAAFETPGSSECAGRD